MPKPYPRRPWPAPGTGFSVSPTSKCRCRAVPYYRMYYQPVRGLGRASRELRGPLVYLLTCHCLPQPRPSAPRDCSFAQQHNRRSVTLPRYGVLGALGSLGAFGTRGGTGPDTKAMLLQCSVETADRVRSQVVAVPAEMEARDSTRLARLGDTPLLAGAVGTVLYSPVHLQQ